MLANLTTPLLGVVSTGAIGQLGDPALLGGVALAAVAFDCVFWLFSFLRAATVAFTAQALGAGDGVEIRAVLIRALWLAALIGALLIALRAPLAALIFNLMGGSEAATTAAKSYFHIRLWSAAFMLGNYVILGWLVGLARTGIALGIQVGVNLLNMVLTVVFVLWLRWGIEGAAYATVIAETVGFGGGLGVARALLGRDHRVPRAQLLDRARWRQMLVVNRDIMIRTAALIGAFLFFTAQGARAGDQVLAANAVLYNFLMIGSFFLDGLANAAEQLCGQTFGARDRARFAQAVRLVLAWSVGFGVAVSLIFLAAGDRLIDIITTSPEVRLAARQFMWLAALAPACGVLAYCFDGVFIGASWARDMRNLMVTAFAVYIAAWYALAPWGNAGLWIAFLIFLLARGFLQAIRYPVLLRATFAPG
ncbi:MAG: MATE family efflux transporter [Xanthobacteraceae bacterium]|nr:MATE family efflux transporter [Xanthobacteraceae bacterium]